MTRTRGTRCRIRHDGQVSRGYIVAEHPSQRAGERYMIEVETDDGRYVKVWDDQVEVTR